MGSVCPRHGSIEDARQVIGRGSVPTPPEDLRGRSFDASVEAGAVVVPREPWTQGSVSTSQGDGDTVGVHHALGEDRGSPSTRCALPGVRRDGRCRGFARSSLPEIRRGGSTDTGDRGVAVGAFVEDGSPGAYSGKR